MKKIAMLSFGVLFSTMMFAGVANENPSDASKVNVKKENESTFVVTYKPEKAMNVSVSIVNELGQTIFSETLKNTDGFMRPYNFSGLGEGVYTIEIADASGEHTEFVDFRSGKGEKSINVKKIAGADGKYLLTASGAGKESITINIYDAFDALLHTETAETDGNFGQVYNLGKVDNAVKFEITTQYGAVKTVKY